MVTNHDPVEIVTIGGGMTASIIAAKVLPSTSHRMVSIEQGPAQWTYPDFAHNHDSLRFENRYAMMQDLRRTSWTWRPGERAQALPIRQYGAFNPGQGLGGSMVHWTGITYRFLPSDFRWRSHHIERYGASALPEEMTSQDWPLSFEELEPYYDAFEYDIGVSGQAGNLAGQQLPGGNIFEGPRSRPYPLPPLAPMPFGDLFDSATVELGLHPFPTPAGLLSQGYTDPYGHVRAACLYCGFCTRFGCEVGAKGTPLTTWLPVALGTGRYEVRTRSLVVGIETDAEGMATGVRYLDPNGEENFQPAEVVICSAFTLENVRNLLLARSDAHPGGIGNDRGQVGRNFTYQVYQTPVTGLWEGRRFNRYMGNGVTDSSVYDYYGDNFDHSGLGFVGGGRFNSAAGEVEPVGTVGGLLEGFVPQQWGAEWKRQIAANYDAVGGLTMQAESPAYAGNYLDLDPTFTDRWGRPLLRITFEWRENERRMYRYLAERAREIMEAMSPTRSDFTSELAPFRIDEYQTTHPTGGAIISSDPDTGVSNSYGQVWDTPNVFVTGASQYPQNAGGDASATAASLALRTGQAIRDRYFEAPRQLLT